MAINDISLTAGMRTNLVNLQATSSLLDRTQTRLSTGKKVNTALDDPTSFFTAQSHNNRARDLAGYKDGMSEAIQTIKSADTGITGITALINSAKGLAASAKSLDTADAAGRAALASQYDVIMDQLDLLATDSNYKGVNFLAAGSLDVQFGSGATDLLTIVGFDADSTNLVGSNIATGAWATNADIDTDITNLDLALGTLREESKKLSSNLGIINARQDFTSGMIANLNTGADNLTLADMNEEGANMLMLQTRQSLGVTALSLASQAAQSVLRLFG
jgi:flagellin